MKSRLSKAPAKARRTAEELIALVRRDLAGKYAGVSITIQSSGDSWFAIAEVESALTRERIERVAERIRRFNDLA